MSKSERDRVYRTTAFILSRRDYGEADRLLTIFTPNAGKQEWIAKGIRKTTSRKAGHLELFTHASLLVAKARTWDIITEVSTIESFRHLRETLETIAYASYLCELVSCFTEADDENQPLWDLLLFSMRTLNEYAQALSTATEQGAGGSTPSIIEQSTTTEGLTEISIDRVTAAIALHVRWFELQLLSISGFQPQLFQCLQCSEPIAPTTNFLSLENGGILCPRCAAGQTDVEPIDVDVLKILRHLQRSRWVDLQATQIRPFILLAVENILHRYLLTVLEHQLKSIQFLRNLQSTLPKLTESVRAQSSAGV